MRHHQTRNQPDTSDDTYDDTYDDTVVDDIETLIATRKQTCNRWTIRLFGTRKNGLPVIATISICLLVVLFDTYMFSNATIRHSINSRLPTAGAALTACAITCTIVWAHWRKLEHIKQHLKNAASELPHTNYNPFRLEQTLIDLGQQKGTWNLVCQFGLTRHSELIRTLIHSCADQPPPHGWNGTIDTYRDTVRVILSPTLRPILNALDRAAANKWTKPPALHGNRAAHVVDALSTRVHTLHTTHTIISNSPEGTTELTAAMIAGHNWDTTLNITETAKLAAAICTPSTP